MLKNHFHKSLPKISEPYQSKIIGTIRKLAFDTMPQNSKKLRGRNAWRLRIGRYRIIYDIINNELVVLVLDINHRKDIYKN